MKKKKYDIILMDPPLPFNNRKDKNKKTAVSKYNLMTWKELKNFKLLDFCKKDCVLLMWSPSCYIEGCLELIKEWGFIFKNISFVWVKMNKKQNTPFFGLGFYTRLSCEFVLLATRGHGIKVNSKSVRQVIHSKIREHSRKPDELYDRINELFGNKDKIELFARQKVDGWDSFGDEINKFNKIQK